jgi:hypothetical protein
MFKSGHFLCARPALSFTAQASESPPKCDIGRRAAGRSVGDVSAPHARSWSNRPISAELGQLREDAQARRFDKLFKVIAFYSSAKLD